MATSTRNAGSVQAKSITRPGARPAAVRRNVGKSVMRSPTPAVTTPANGASANGKPEARILFQKHFKSVGPRSYGAQLKELPNGNHLLVLTETKRDSQTGDVRKNRTLVFGEDLLAFFRLLHETATFIRANPVPEEIRKRREKFWARKARDGRNGASRSDE